MREPHCRIFFIHFPFSVPFLLYCFLLLPNHRVGEFPSFDQSYEVLGIHHDLSFIVLFLTFLCLKSFSPLWRFFRYEVAISSIFFLRLEFKLWLEDRLIWVLVVFEHFELFHEGRVIIFSKRKRLFQSCSIIFSLLWLNFPLLLFSSLYHFHELLRLGYILIVTILRYFDSTLANYSYFFVFGVRTKNIIGIFVIWELKVEIFYNFVGSFHLFLIWLNLDVPPRLQVYEFFDFGEVLHAAWPLLKQYLQLTVSLLKAIYLLVVSHFQSLELFSH